MKKEVQHFKGARWLFYVMLAGLFLLIAAVIAYAAGWAWWWIIGIAGLPMFITGFILWKVFKGARLESEVSAGGISVYWSAGMKQPRFIPWSDIESVIVIDNPRPNFAGNKFVPGATYYSMMNAKAARINLKNGKVILIGTNQPEIWRSE